LLGVSRLPLTASTVLEIALASSMLYAAASKVAAPWNLKKTINGLGLSRSAWPLTYVVISLEGAIGLTTALGIFVTVVSIAASSLLTVFAAAGLWARARGLSVSCSCFGIGLSKLGPKSAGRAGLLVLGYLGYATFPPSASFVDWAAPTVVLVILALGISAWFQVVTDPMRIGT
jgi:hypothetical protein